MELVVAGLFACFAVAYVLRTRGRDSQLQVTTYATLVFAVPFYCVPIFFKPYSRLANYHEEDVLLALLIHCGFCATALLSALFFSRRSHIVRPLELRFLDDLIANRPFITGLWVAAAYLIFSTNYMQSIYQSDTLGEYSEKTLTGNFGFWGAVFPLLLALLCVCISILLRQRRIFEACVLASSLVIYTLQSLASVQRALIALPAANLVAALFVYGHTKYARTMLLAGIVGLAIISPAAVYVREASKAEKEVSSVTDFISVGAIEDMIKSIVERADLIENTIRLKQYVDVTEFVGWQYYWSVLTVPVPRFIYPEKPTALSSDGTPRGEASVLAWHLINSGEGSLTAFGGIVAYRQGGWLVMLLDAMAVGLLMVISAQWLGRGGPVGTSAFVLLVISASLRKAPPSFCEYAAALLAVVPFILLLALLSWLCSALTRVRRL